MDNEKNKSAKKNSLVKREEFDAVISPGTFKKFKSRQKVSAINAPNHAPSTSSALKGNGSIHQRSSDGATHVIKVSVQEYDALKQKYTGNKNGSPKKEASETATTKPKSPSSRKQFVRCETSAKGKSSTSPRLSSGGLKQNVKNSQNNSEKTQNPPTINQSSDKILESKYTSRKSFDSGIKSKKNPIVKSRRSEGVVRNINNSNNNGNEKINKSFSDFLNKAESSNCLSPVVGDGVLEIKGQQKSNGKKKSPKILPIGRPQNVQSIRKNGSEKEEEIASIKSFHPKVHDSSKRENNTRRKSKESQRMKKHKELEKTIRNKGASLIGNIGQGDQNMDSSEEKNDQSNNRTDTPPHLNNGGIEELCSTQDSCLMQYNECVISSDMNFENCMSVDDSSYELGSQECNSFDSINFKSIEDSGNSGFLALNGTATDSAHNSHNFQGIEDQENKGMNFESFLSVDDSSFELGSQECNSFDSIGFKDIEGSGNRNGFFTFNGTSADPAHNSHNFQEIEGQENKDAIIENAMKSNFVTKRTDKFTTADTLKPSVNLDDCLKIDDSPGVSNEKDLNSNTSPVRLAQFEAVAGGSKNINLNSIEERHFKQANLSSVSHKSSKIKYPPARIPIILKTPKRMKDGEVMSEMLIYKLGAHSTPRKIRKNRNLDSSKRSDWGTPATDRITSAYLKRSITKKSKGKMFIKKTSKGTLHSIASKRVLKNSPRGEKPKKCVQSGDEEVYKVTPVSALIKQFENLQTEKKPSQAESKVTIMIKKNSISEKWQNATSNIKEKLSELREVKKSNAEVKDGCIFETSNENSLISNIMSDNNEKDSATSTDLDKYFESPNNILNAAYSECDDLSMVSLKFDEIFSDECASNQTAKNMRFSDLFKEINPHQFNLENNCGTSEINNLKESEKDDKTVFTREAPLEKNISSDGQLVASLNENGQEKSLKENQEEVKNGHGNSEEEQSVDDEKLFEHGSLENEAGNNFRREKEILEHNIGSRNQIMEEGVQLSNHSKKIDNDKEGENLSGNYKRGEAAHVDLDKETVDERHIEILDNRECFAESAIEAQEVRYIPMDNACHQLGSSMDEFHGFEDVEIKVGEIDMENCEERASPAYEVGVDEVIDDDFGETYRQEFLNLRPQGDDDNTAVSDLIALTQKLPKQPTSYADYRKQFMLVKSLSLPPQKTEKYDFDSKMSL